MSSQFIATDPRLNDINSKTSRHVLDLPGIQTISAGLTIVANVAIATGPALLGSPRSSVINLIYYITYKIFFSLRS